jgi:hypothetical protein
MTDIEAEQKPDHNHGLAEQGFSVVGQTKKRQAEEDLTAPQENMDSEPSGPSDNPRKERGNRSPRSSTVLGPF